MKRRMKKNFIAFLFFFIGLIVMIIGTVVYLDPFFHYHGPNIKYFYLLDNQRYQNYGIVSNMEYEAIITGTSLTDNFKTSQFKNLFGVEAIKVPFSGATYYETKQLLEKAFSSDNQIKYVFRSLDINHLIEAADQARDDLGVIPEYLCNDDLRDDYQYWLNKDVLIDYVFPMLSRKNKYRVGGITSFDEYCSWKDGFPLNLNNWDLEIINDQFELQSLSDAELEILESNIKNNIYDLVNEHPETIFLYYIPPYPTLWWYLRCREGNLKKYCEAQKYLYKMLENCDNVKIFCYSNEIDITSNWNNYVDEIHYNDKINNQILEWISQDYGLLTNENFNEVLDEQYEIYCHFDYVTNAKQGIN